MRLTEFVNKPQDLETVINNISPERRERLRKVVEEFNQLVQDGVKSLDQLDEYIDEKYDSI